MPTRAPTSGQTTHAQTQTTSTTRSRAFCLVCVSPACERHRNRREQCAPRPFVTYNCGDTEMAAQTRRVHASLLCQWSVLPSVIKKTTLPRTPAVKPDALIHKLVRISAHVCCRLLTFVHAGRLQCGNKTGFRLSGARSRIAGCRSSGVHRNKFFRGQ